MDLSIVVEGDPLAYTISLGRIPRAGRTFRADLGALGPGRRFLCLSVSPGFLYPVVRCRPAPGKTLACARPAPP